MLPALCFTFFGLFVLLVCLVAVPVIGFVWADEIRRYLNNVAAKTGTEPFTVTEAVTAAWISIVIVTGLFGISNFPLFFHKNDGTQFSYSY